MFVGIARVSLSFPHASSLKDKRQVLRKLLDRLRARFNAAAAEVDGNDLWQRGVIGIAVVGNSRRFAQESLDTILHFIEESYLAPVIDRSTEVIPVGDASYGSVAVGHGGLAIDAGNRTLAEAEGLLPGPPDDEDAPWDEDGEDR